MEDGVHIVNGWRKVLMGKGKWCVRYARIYFPLYFPFPFSLFPISQPLDIPPIFLYHLQNNSLY